MEVDNLSQLHQLVRITHAYSCTMLARAQEVGLSEFRLQLAIAAPLRGSEMAASIDAPTQEEVDLLLVSPLV